MVARKRKRNTITSRQWLTWGLAATVLVAVVYLAMQRPGVDIRDLQGAVGGAAPNKGLMCPARRVASAYIYTDSVTGAGQSFFYWWAYRLAVADALQAATATTDNVVAKANQQLSCPAGCERQGEAVCKRMRYNPADPAYKGKFGRLLARHTCRQVRALRDGATRLWLVKVSCRALYSCLAMCKKIEAPIVAPDPEPNKPPVGKQPEPKPDLPPNEDPLPGDSAPDEDPLQPAQPPQEPVATSEPSVQDAQDII